MLLANLELKPRDGALPLANGTQGRVLDLCPLEDMAAALIPTKRGAQGNTGPNGFCAEAVMPPGHLRGDVVGGSSEFTRFLEGLVSPNRSPSREGAKWREICPMIPLVEFGGGARRAWVFPHAFDREYPQLGIAQRTVLPLRLSWSMTIHKSQGATLDFVEYDIDGAFAPGMVYTALSRVTSMEGLQVVGSYHESHIPLEDKCVADFFEQIRTTGRFTDGNRAYREMMERRQIDPALLVDFEAGGGLGREERRHFGALAGFVKREADEEEEKTGRMP